MYSGHYHRIFAAPENAGNADTKHWSGAIPILLLAIPALATGAYSSLDILQSLNPDLGYLKRRSTTQPHQLPMGVYGHVEVGLVWKLDLQGLWFFLGHDDVHLRYVQDGQLVAQLPFLALTILQPVGRLEGGTHFGVLPESGTNQEFL